MANEISITASLQAKALVASGSFKFDFLPDQLIVDFQTAAGGSGGYTQIIGTLEEVVDGLGDLATLGYCVLVNTDVTNYVSYGPEYSGSMRLLGRLKAGEFAILRLEPGITLRAQANTAPVKLSVTVLED